MTAEKYLEEIKKIDDIILTKLKEYKRWVDVADEIGGFSVSDRVQSTRNNNKSSTAIGSYVDVEREIKELKRQKSAIIGTLQQLPFNEYKVLYKIYVDGLILKELPSEFDKSYTWVKDTRKRALRHLQEILDEKRG